MEASSKFPSTESTASKEQHKRKSTDVGWEYAVLADPNNLKQSKMYFMWKSDVGRN